MIDDVWSGGPKTGISPETGIKYPLMSAAIEAGLYHPRCRDSHTTYFEGISTPPSDSKYTRDELDALVEQNRQEAKQQYAERQTKKFDRMARYSLDGENQKKYELRASEWKDAVERQNADNRFNVEMEYKKFIKKLSQDDTMSNHKALMKLYCESTDLVESADISAPFVYSLEDDVIKYNPHAPYISDYDMDYVFSHEISHRMDELEYHSWEDKSFVEAIEKCAKKVYDNKKEVQKWFEPGGKYERTFAVSDIIDALTNGEVQTFVGHSKSYWKKSVRLKAMEVFADISSLDVTNTADYDVRDLLSELLYAYKGVIE